LLIDTHIFVWSSSNPSRLTDAQRAAIAGETSTVFVSAVTAWEIAIKAALGRLAFLLNSFETIRVGMGFSPLPITLAHGIAAGGLPRHHGDPFDRMLIAQARSEGLTLVTADRALRRYDVPILD
jgi:PIN domain nuclease of toxin-antitoxin system